MKPKGKPDGAVSTAGYALQPAPPASIRKQVLAALAIVAIYFSLLSFFPLRTAVQIGADEGFELAKATLCAHGYKLYVEVWNDQPPLHTYILTKVFDIFGNSILHMRLVTILCTVVMLLSLFKLAIKVNDFSTAVILCLLVIAAPGFLELSSSCMLEVPALSVAVAALCVAAVAGSPRWLVDCATGALLAISLQLKLINVIWLPLIGLIYTLKAQGWRKNSTGSRPNFSRQSVVSVSKEVTLRMLTLAIVLAAVYVLVDLFIDNGAYLANFGQSWNSHFGEVKSEAYGSPKDRIFDWKLLAKNWDLSAPALVGLWVVIRRFRSNALIILPVAWLVLALTVFSIHRPWWAYYYVHITLPLAWCAAIGVATLWKGAWAVGQGTKSKGIRSPWPGKLAFGAFVAVLLAWGSLRVHLQVRTIRQTPQTFSTMVLKEMDRYRQYNQWLFTDQLAYSFHANIPIPPPVAVIPLKRLWSGEINDAGIAREVEKYKPGLIQLRNHGYSVAFQPLLEREYRMIYQDERQRLFAHQDVIARQMADEMKARQQTKVAGENGK